MSLMFNEKVEKSRVPFIIMTTVTVLTAIILSQLGKALIISHTLEVIMDVILFGTFLFLTWRMHISSKVIRKYSIVTNALYVHNILDNEPVLIKKIKLADIESIKRTGSIIDRLKGMTDCSLFLYKDMYKVRYNENGKSESYIIAPSEKMINKLKVSMVPAV